jgi:hypothetical protein
VKRSLVCLVIAAFLATIIGIVTRHLVYNAAEWQFARILLIMFLVGVALTCNEIAKWWEARMMQLRPPPLFNLITYVRAPDQRWHATHVLGFALPDLRAIPERLHHPVQSIEKDQSKKAA